MHKQQHAEESELNFKLTDFGLLRRQIQRLGTNPQELELRLHLSKHSIITPIDRVIFGKEGIYWITPCDGVTKVAVHEFVCDTVKSGLSARAAGFVRNKDWNNNALIEELGNYHFIACDKLQRELRSKKHAQLCVTRNNTNAFHYEFKSKGEIIFSHDNQVLNPCPVCLKEWEGMKSVTSSLEENEDELNKNSNANTNVLTSFLDHSWEKHWVMGIYRPDSLSPPGIYPGDWKLIERVYKARTNYRCDSPMCAHPNLSEAHLHQYLRCSYTSIGDKIYDHWLLQPICINCYAQKPGYEAISQQQDYVEFKKLLKQLR